MTSEFFEIHKDHALLVGAVGDLQDARFPYLTRQEIRERKRDLSRRLVLDTCFQLISRLEARLKEAALRGMRRQKNRPQATAISTIGTYLQRFAKDRDLSPRIAAQEVPVEALLLALRDHFRLQRNELHRTVSLAKGYFKTFRNWYAHGRPPVQVTLPPDAEEVLRIVSDIYDGLD